MRHLKQLCANLENRPDRKTIKSVLTLVISCLSQRQGRKRLLEVKTSHLLFILTVPRGLISGWTSSMYWTARSTLTICFSVSVNEVTMPERRSVTDSAYEIAKPTRPLEEGIGNNIIINTTWMLPPWHLKFNGVLGTWNLRKKEGGRGWRTPPGCVPSPQKITHSKKSGQDSKDPSQLMENIIKQYSRAV